MRTSIAYIAALIGATCALQEASPFKDQRRIWHAPRPEDFMPVRNGQLQHIKLENRRPIRRAGYGGYGYGQECPKYLTAEYVESGGIFPISQTMPNTAFGNVSCPVVTPNDFCTIFSLTIPKDAINKTCTLEFIFPELEQTHPYYYYYYGEGNFEFIGYTGYTGSAESTWNHQPPPGPAKFDPPPQHLVPGNVYTLNKPEPGNCLVNGTYDLIVGGRICSKDSYLSYYQDASTPCPMGLFVEIS